MERTAAFQFELGADVTIACSGETGQVIGRAEYTNATPSYFIRYSSKAERGGAVEKWWSEEALTK